MASGKKNAITKIELEVSGKKIALTLEEAKSLREILNDLMGEKEIRWFPTYPYQTTPWPYPHWYGTYCGSGGTGTLTVSNTGGGYDTTATVNDETRGDR